MLGALERPSSGRVRLAGQLVGGLAEDAVSAIRNRTVGFVFQFHHLLRAFSALENVMMPLRIAGVDSGVARERAEALLERVGLAARMHHRPGALSGGEQQRTAVAAPWPTGRRCSGRRAQRETWICTTQNDYMIVSPNWRVTPRWDWWW
jgi:lipoprotein-releasing system ATP-binding protein